MKKSKYFIFTLGCQMNISDSQRIATKLEEIGYKSASEKEADLIVVNACSVRQHAVDRIWGGIKNWKKAGKKIMITGCVLKDDRRKLKDRGVDFFSIKDLGNAKNFLLNSHSEVSTEESPANAGSHIRERSFTNVQDDNHLDYLNIKVNQSGKIAYIPIMTGCDNFCSYCAVPYTRGREISRSMKSIIIEVKDAINNRYKEILLLGQNVNSYSVKNKCTYADNLQFIQLLKAVDNLDGDFKFNFMSSNPHDMTDNIIEAFSELKKWPRELHLPMQSGDDIILKKMNRKYDSGQYLKLIKNLKLKIKNLILTTDIIVGFPTETKAQFNNTVKICKKIGFKKVYIGQYSPRPGTVSAKMIDDVSKEEKKRRWLVLNKLINK